jgi:hypothetical protein
MIFYRVAIIVFSILFLQSCSDKKEERKTNLNSTKPKLKDFLFIGMIKDKAGLYKYELDKKAFKLWWSDKREEVVELSYSEKMQNVFFITSKYFGKAGAFPFINNIKLYLMNPETGRANFIEEIGNGLQVFTQWADENNFRIIINSFDKTVANYVNHRKILYNIYGKKLEDITETFDITKQGYPQPPEKKIDYFYPEKNYSIENRVNDSTAVYLKEDETDRLIIKSDQQIKQIEWENEFLFLSTIKIKPNNESLNTEIPQISKLIVYSLEQSQILKMWVGGGVKNFFVAGDFLVFDDGFGKDSHIIIYDLKNKKIYDEIRIKRGCGLKNIPQIPDYEG